MIAVVASLLASVKQSQVMGKIRKCCTRDYTLCSIKQGIVRQ